MTEKTLLLVIENNFYKGECPCCPYGNYSLVNYDLRITATYILIYEVTFFNNLNGALAPRL